MVETRPDIDFAIFVVSYFVKNPSSQYIKAVKMIMRYFKATKMLDIIYNREKNNNLIIKDYSDSN